MYEYEDYFVEPSEFDEKCSELIDLLRENAKDEIKAELEAKDREIERLKALNKEMKDVYDNYQSKVRDLEAAKRDYLHDESTLRAKIEQELLKEKLSSLLKDVYSELYEVINVGKHQHKCDKCDEKGYIHYKTPSGKDAKELCSCREPIPYYEVRDTHLVEFHLGSDSNIHGMYRINSKLDGEWFDRISSDVYLIYKGQAFEKIRSVMTYFTDKAKAQEYADWLNNKQK